MDSNTHFRNSKKRIIYVSAKGKFFIKKSDGTKTYKPKAAFHVRAPGTLAVRVHSSHNIPAPIRPAAIAGRRVRKNKGGMRMTEAKAFQMIFNTPGAPRKKRARKAAPARTGLTPRHPSGRRIRTNKGVARGPREGHMQRKMDAESKRRAMQKKKLSLRMFKRSNPFAALSRQ